jgi:colanic acid/amylovoran biosynthesis glycosyltransferase
MLTMIHSNPARIANGKFRVDRKFHSGMKLNVESIQEPILSIHPENAADAQVMDAIEIPLDELGYQVMTVEVDSSGRASAGDRQRLRSQISRSKLLYGTSLGGASLAQEVATPYITIREYDLQTQIKFTTSAVSSVLRRTVRTIRCFLSYVFSLIPEMRNAYGLHCNGYPVFDEARRFNERCLLYLDSRMLSSMVISPDDLQTRLMGFRSRPVRLLYSGRYEVAKGALHAIQVGLECKRLGLEFEMHCYGQGSLKNEMVALAASKGNKEQIFVHDAISYPDLVSLSKTFDLFVCCHIQSDPSCTYLESFGAGLPVVGYDNRMWKRLCKESGAGFATALGSPKLVAQSIKKLLDHENLLAKMSHLAREFALAHSFELEHALRISEINAALKSISNQPIPQISD